MWNVCLQQFQAVLLGVLHPLRRCGSRGRRHDGHVQRIGKLDSGLLRRRLVTRSIHTLVIGKTEYDGRKIGLILVLDQFRQCIQQTTSGYGQVKSWILALMDLIDNVLAKSRCHIVLGAVHAALWPFHDVSRDGKVNGGGRSDRSQRAHDNLCRINFGRASHWYGGCSQQSFPVLLMMIQAGVERFKQRFFNHVWTKHVCIDRLDLVCCMLGEHGDERFVIQAFAVS